MTVLGIELNDAAISVVDGRSRIVSAPGYAVGRGGEIVFGADAWKLARLHPQQTSHRFWRDLSDQQMARFMDGRYSAADLAHDQLQMLCADFMADVEGVIFSVPAHWSPEQLGLLLGIAQDLSLPVRGLVDSAVAATRRLYNGRDLLHIDASLHELTMTRMLQAGNSAVGERRTVERVGIEGLERCCVEFIARRFVEATRFDPLHHGESEQYLYDHLYGWLNSLNREKTVDLTIEFGGNEFQLDLARPELAGQVVKFLEPVVQQARNLLSAGEPVAVQLGNRIAEFPGVVEAVARLSKASAFVLEPAAAAHGALRRAGSMAPTDAGIRLTGALPFDQPAVDSDDSPEVVETPVAAARQPTHVVYDGCAYRLGKRSFSIGSELPPGEFGVVLGGGRSGVSRRHCTIRVGDNGIEVIDNSRYGTLLNGHAIDGIAILQGGDILSLGNPCSDFLMISEVVPDSTD
jgi:hypothetical protein